MTADAVTGKLDVRDLAPAPGEEITEVENLDEDIHDAQIVGDDEPGLLEEVADGQA